jgi:ankyrin repeat protein
MTWNDVLDAVRGGDLDRLNSLLERDPSLAEARDEQGTAALMHAIYRRRPDLVARLRAARARLEASEAAALGAAPELAARLREDAGAARSRTPDGFTPLHLAAYFGGAECAALLLEHGADPEDLARNPMAVRPIHSATSAGQADVVALLLRSGANANARQQAAITPLMQAAHAGNRGLVELLLAHGADPALQDETGKTARDYATAAGQAALATRLAPAAP